MKTTPQPKFGLIVCFAWFPDHNHPNQPGEKYRPVLICDFDPSTKMFTCIYGTSQNTNRCGAGEFVVAMEGLSKPTKFCCAYQRKVPASDIYFCQNGQKHVVGPLPQSFYKQFGRALLETI